MVTGTSVASPEAVSAGSSTVGADLAQANMVIAIMARIARIFFILKTSIYVQITGRE
jgi:hypothetical protein